MVEWNTEISGSSTGAGGLTIVEGSSFAVCGTNGDLLPGTHHGVYFRDTRFVSQWLFRMNGQPLDFLAAMTPRPYRAVFVGRVWVPGITESSLIVERIRQVGVGLREEIRVRNFSGASAQSSIDLEIGSDFADLFEVKGGTIQHSWVQSAREVDGKLVIESEWNGRKRGITITAAGASIVGERLYYQQTVPAHSEWVTTIVATPTIDGEVMQSGFPAYLPLSDSRAARRFSAWESKLPTMRVDDPGLRKTLERSEVDLGSLRIHDPKHLDREVVAAGAPWFMALFGRDSLLTSYMALPVDPELAAGTLNTLADLQGKATVAATEEQPGRILHEVRLGVEAGPGLGGASVYYGSVDATPLFVVLLGELHRWGSAEEHIAGLLPVADRALEWIEHYGDRDGDGFVEYQRATDNGLVNQGWKDSWDGINFADGSLANPPIALCEVQGYVYAAYLARGLLARRSGDESAAAEWARRAAELKEAFNERFWMPDRGYFAIALDADKRPVDSCASNMGHCLWSGIVDEDKAAAVAERLLSAEMFSGWGVRTLASNMGAYNPTSYHNGSIWPHDNALIAAGLMRYGFVEESQRVATAMLEAAEVFGGRLPELFCGFARERYSEPVSYPTSCSPQAWASAAPLLLLRSLARFDPCIPDRRVWIDPAFPEGFGRLSIERLPLAGTRVSVEFKAGRPRITGLPDGINLHRAPRPTSQDLAELQRA